VKKTLSMSISLIFCLAMTTGCASQRSTEQIGGATIGGLLGLAGGLVADSEDETMVALAVGGALLGWAGIMLMQSGDSSTAKAEGIEGPPSWKGGAIAHINHASTGSETVQPGQALELVTDYSVTAAAGTSATVEEVWTLRRGDTEIASVRTGAQQRSAGQWSATPKLLVPADAKPGSYEVEHFVAVDGSFDRAVSRFEVAG
jgi:hypothetical protein